MSEESKGYKNMPKKIYIRTYGCQMNIRDSEVIMGLLTTNDYQLTTKPEKADIIIFNTCSVRQHAEDKVWSEIGRFKDKKIIGLVGCMASNYKDKIFDRAPNVNFVTGPQDLHKIPEIIKKLTQDQGLFKRKIWETDGELRPEEIYHTGFYADKEHAYVVISEGCSNFCSYCVVPYVRGELRNRKFNDVLKEVKEAIDKGITKITLLGQNVNAYNYDNVNFVKLVKLVNSVKGLRELSFITSHPKDTTLDLFKAMADLEKLKRYLHLPVQSGSDRILKLMNRSYTRKFYLDLVDNYRKIVKDSILTTDVMVGFPSETEEDFQDTYDLIRGVQFNAAYIFKYSLRPNTEAAKVPDDIAREDKERRHRLILELQKEISRNSKIKIQKSK
jgi:tRNA-2-methylthio-N6-dimethylallyladenosine synthase